VTEADVQNEEMYEEEDDEPVSFAYGLGSSPFELRMRMQAYWEQQFAVRNAMSLAASGGNLNSTGQPPLSLRDYYQRFAQQYPLSLTTNQYLFPSSQLPVNPPVNAQPNPSLAPPETPARSLSPSHSNSPTKSPGISGVNNRRLSLSTIPYSVSNSQRIRRATAAEQPINQPLPGAPVPSTVKCGLEDYTKSFLTEDMYTTQPLQSSVVPFTTQLPIHMQQYHLPDFVNPVPSIPVQSVPLDKVSFGDATDVFSANDWSSFLGENQAPPKFPQREENTNWDDYLDSDANWLLGAQPEHESC
jgi:hypothetical protein